VLGFCLPWFVMYTLRNPVAITFQNHEQLFAVLLGGVFAMLALGIYDDCKGADASKKFIAQILIAVGLWVGGYRIDHIENPWAVQAFDLGRFSLPLTVLWIVGVTNAINLLDGIDGLVAGVTACIALSLAVINAISGNIIVTLLTLALAGACLGFLGHNHAPANIFLGDSGSLTIGLVLACIGIVSVFNQGSGSAGPIITVPLILFSLPLFDTLRVMILRLLRGVSIFQADRNHVHHRLLDLGMNHRQAAWTLYGVGHRPVPARCRPTGGGQFGVRGRVGQPLLAVARTRSETRRIGIRFGQRLNGHDYLGSRSGTNAVSGFRPRRGTRRTNPSQQQSALGWSCCVRAAARF
jgi:UDP-GlcNAc:undecaprenyl-phosphate/decaprenyl-phosphate GlcNAc-1-phosphate transferase